LVLERNIYDAIRIYGKGKADFSGASFQYASFGGAIFKDYADFSLVRFKGDAFFDRTTFRDISFEKAVMNRDFSFIPVQLEKLNLQSTQVFFKGTSGIFFFSCKQIALLTLLRMRLTKGMVGYS
jgi:uncharacterized protein YjbI with pentapeptide repeats